MTATALGSQVIDNGVVGPRTTTVRPIGTLYRHHSPVLITRSADYHEGGFLVAAVVRTVQSAYEV